MHSILSISRFAVRKGGGYADLMDTFTRGRKSLLTKLGPVLVSSRLDTINRAFDVIPTEMRMR